MLSIKLLLIQSLTQDDFYGEWCDEDGNFNLHGGYVGCVHDSQSLLLQSDDLWLDQVAFNNWLKMFSVEDTRSQSRILC